MRQGIDISKWQGKVDWGRLAAQHAAGTLDFVILRAGYGGGTVDPLFEQNYAAATAAGIPVGAYWYAYWGKYTPSQEAAGFLRAVAGKRLVYGIWYDVEYEPDILALSKKARTDGVLAALRTLAASGRYVGLYASTDMVNNRLEFERLRGYDLWCAQYGPRCTGKLPFGLWQYTSSGSVDGIVGRVDCDRAYKDYPAIITGTLATGKGAAAGGGETGAGDGGGTDADTGANTDTGAGSGTGAGTGAAAGGTPRPDEPQPMPGTVTRRYGPMTRGDLARMLTEASERGLYALGEVTIGPATAGDDAALRALAASLGLTCREAV